MKKTPDNKTPRKPRSKTNGFNYVYRFRTHRSLKKRAQRVADARGFGQDAADIGREGVTKLVLAEEKRLKLPPLQEAVA